ncbi:hypothetical protein QQF64_031194 [Cirrhinus molitorella]|uniref:Uncharacterized protein n=1 Tax=Cirrhinus molitorella TaxID=172907 RepID=A0ABR3MWC4_9TELE
MPILSQDGGHVRLEGHIPLKIEACDFFTPRAIHHLLQETPTLLLFRNNRHGLGLRHIIQPVTTHLTDTLYTLLAECRGLGGVNHRWMAFQYELALEEMFYGKPYSPQSVQFAVSLGTNSKNPNSLTKCRGFLGLSPVGSARVGEDPPPIETWISDPLQRMRVRRIFPLTDALDACPAIIAQALINVLLCNLHERNDRIPVESYKQSAPPLMSKLVGCRTTSDFCKDKPTG